MQRVTRSTAVAVQPARPANPSAPGFFTGGNPSGGIAATTPGYEWFNDIQEEIAGAVLRAGIALAAGDQAQLRKALDRLYGGGLRTLSASGALTPDDAGLVLVNAAAGNVVVSLPAASAANGRPIQYRLVRLDNTANAVTITRVGADTIEGVSSIGLAGQWGSLTLISDGISSWLQVAGAVASTTRRGASRLATAAEADAAVLADVAVTPAALGVATRLLAANGYQRLPGGLIVQWGAVGAIAVGGFGVFTFPLTFPNAVFAAVVSADTTSNASPITLSTQASGSNNSQMTIRNSGGTPVGGFVIAVGH